MHMAIVRPLLASWRHIPLDFIQHFSQWTWLACCDNPGCWLFLSSKSSEPTSSLSSSSLCLDVFVELFFLFLEEAAFVILVFFVEKSISVKWVFWLCLAAIYDKVPHYHLHANKDGSCMLPQFSSINISKARHVAAKTAACAFQYIYWMWNVSVN